MPLSRITNPFLGSSGSISTTDNTNAALRITQLGTGNALTVEDSANPDATPFVVDANGAVIAGYTSRFSAIDAIAVQSAGSATQLGFSAYNWNATGVPRLAYYKSTSGTTGTYGTSLASGTNISFWSFYGDDGTAFVEAARITAAVDGTTGVGDMPGRLMFSTTADGASSPTERMRIDSAGDVGIGTTTPVTKLEVAGNNNITWSVTASITGTTMNVTAVASSGIVVGDLVFGANIQAYTRVTALGTGTGGIGTYTVSVSQTAASGSVTGGATYGNTLIRITDTDTAQNIGQPTGGLQFFTSDGSSPTAGVGAYVAALAESVTPDTALVFGTRDNAGGGIDANERMRIDSSGNVGIGTNSPSSILNVKSSAPIFRLETTGTVTSTGTAVNVIRDSTGNDVFQNGFAGLANCYQFSTILANGFMRFLTGAQVEAMRIDSSGRLLVGATGAIDSETGLGVINATSGNPVTVFRNSRNTSGDVCSKLIVGSNCQNTSSFLLQGAVSGVANVIYIFGNGNVVNTNNSYGALSDVKLKENIVDATPKLADLMQVKVRSYNLIGSTTKQIGVIAQELETVFPAMVDESPDRDAKNNVLETTTKSVKYSVFVPMLIKAIQEQQALITALTARLDAANL